jgi:hypothetical protein
MGFTKLDEGIVHSSIWSEALATRVLWVTMLAMADSQGFVSSSRSGLLRAANIPQSDFDTAILESPDVDSRSPEHDGRRIQKCDGGWTVLNYRRYREFTYSGSREAIKKRKQRDKRGHKRDMSPKGGDISASASSSASSSLNKNLKGINPEDVRLVQLLIDLMVRNNPDSSIIKRLTPDRQAEWIKQCRLLRESDEKKIEDIEAVIRFSQDDKFWQSNILSMSKLREKFDQLWLKARGADPHAGIKEWLKDQEKKDAGKE